MEYTMKLDVEMRVQYWEAYEMNHKMIIMKTLFCHFRLFFYFYTYMHSNSINNLSNYKDKRTKSKKEIQ